MADRSPEQLLKELDLKDYEATALKGLLELGRTTAPNLVEATGIPQARVYTVLESLAEQGFVEIIPKRPKEYQPKSPSEILERAKENRRQAYEDYQRHLDSLADEFVDTFQPLYEQADESVRPTEELFHVVDVGGASETETREIYRETEEELAVVTKSFEYFPSVEPAFEDALDRGVSIRVLFLHPRHLDQENQTIQVELVERVSAFEDVRLRFSNERLPWRGTIADPSLDYESGRAIFLVEQPEVPLAMRQAAVTDNASFVAGMARYVDLIWEYDSVGEYPAN